MFEIFYIFLKHLKISAFSTFRPYFFPVASYSYHLVDSEPVVSDLQICSSSKSSFSARPNYVRNILYFLELLKISGFSTYFFPLCKLFFSSYRFRTVIGTYVCAFFVHISHLFLIGCLWIPFLNSFCLRNSFPWSKIQF